jgi:hypothetical protein
MRFNSEKERLQHPQIKRIPRSLWKELFSDGISDEISNEQLSLIQTPIKELLSNQKWVGAHKENVMAAWVCIFAGNPEALKEDLIQIANLLKISSQKLLRSALSLTCLSLVKQIGEKEPILMQKMIKAEEYQVFRQAAAHGNLEVVRYLAEKTPELIPEMIQAASYDAFAYAAENGHLEVVRYLAEKAPELIQEMIKANNYGAFVKAAGYGRLGVVRFLEQKAPTLLEEMIKAQDYQAFRSAVDHGQLEVLRYLEEKAPALIPEMIKAKNYDAFEWAALYEHFEVLRYVVEKAPELVHEMIKIRGYNVFANASSKGYLEVVRYLEDKAPTLFKEMIPRDSYAMFRRFAECGHLEALRYLEEKAPELVQEMIKAHNYEAFRNAAAWGYLEVLHYLVEKAPTLKENMIQANNYSAFPARHGSEDHLAKTNAFLLSHYSCFAHAEQHYAEYQGRINLFVNDKLVNLHARCQQQEDLNPNAVFELTDPNEIKLCFYIIRNLIRRNDPSLEDKLHFLIQIPAVRALLHTPLTPNHPNELLRLAFNLGNDDAARILLTNSGVRELAEANNFYQQEAQEGRDLRELAQDRESSMSALSQGEQRRMNAVLKLYQPVINQQGVPVLMKQLREQLLARYAKNPSFIIVAGKKIILPATWDEFTALQLEKPAYGEALKAYYQNKDHSAWRYLLKPNPWMSKDAEYVLANPQNPNERYSTFEEYQPVIVLMWLAAQDEQHPPTEDHTLEGRLNHFIDELALLDRSHNWDKSRIKPGTHKEEEYDDLEGDKPTCYSGVKRRLFQSVLGHPLLKILKMEDLKEELHFFIREHIAAGLNKENTKQLKQAYQDYIVSTDLADAAPLKVLDISAAQREQFIGYLDKKYGKQFSRDVFFRKYINTALMIPNDSPQVLDLVAKAKLDDLFALTFQEKLTKCGALGTTLLLQIERLQQAEHSFNPYWINSTKKLNAIIQALVSLPEDINAEELGKLVKNPESALYQALNIQRLSPLTFLGRLGWNHAKSLQVVQEVSAEQPIPLIL